MYKIRILIIFAFALVLFSCAKENDHPNIPIVGVNRQINLNDPLYSDLKIMGGHIYLNQEGARGLLIVHDYFDTFHAIERTCTYKSQDACAKVTLEKNRTFIRCGIYENDD